MKNLSIVRSQVSVVTAPEDICVAMSFLEMGPPVNDDRADVELRSSSCFYEPSEEELVVGEVRFDVRKCLLLVGQKQVRLSRKEGQVLAVLMRDPGRMVSYDELTERIWDGVGVSSNVLAVYISCIRRKLRAQGVAGYLVTVRNIGQVMREPAGRTADTQDNG